jgi:predicted DNA-binding transcriptional regulator YafY
VAEGSEAWVHFGIDAEATESLESVDIEINFMDQELLVEELIEFGASVEVLAPETLKNAVIDQAKKALASHA